MVLVKLRGERNVRYVARTGGDRNAYKNLVEKHEGKRLLGIPCAQKGR
jgi:hypothetical protein